MNSFVQKLRRNPIFGFFSSVRLAIPLMLAIAAVVAAGTVYESMYNTQMARLMVYRTWWFEGLMVLLWLNLFCAALSRYPFKEHHIGFVTTHIGLMTLLVGAQITALWGLDGQLRVTEGQSAGTVTVENLVVKVLKEDGSVSRSYPVSRGLSARSGEVPGLARMHEETGLSAENYLPFVTEEASYEAAAPGESGTDQSVAVKFSLQSAFFQVSDSLHSVDKPEAQMGPAHLRLVVDQVVASAPPNPAQAPSQRGRDASELWVKDGAQGAVLGRIDLAKLRKGAVDVRGTRVALVRVYAHAGVAGGKLVEGASGTPNPALELRLEHEGQAQREVVFSKFPAFSLNAKGSFGLSFEYHDGAPSSGEAAPPASEGAPQGVPGGNVIEFRVTRGDIKGLRIVLLKNGEQVLSQRVSSGEVLQTPWMGMKITLDAITVGGKRVQTIRPTQLARRAPLPPSAIFLRSDLPGDEGVWLEEGTSRVLQTALGPREVYYGEDSVQLPFEVKLDRFRKVDYPGTETPMSFESLIRMNGAGSAALVQMNEPFNYDGYLLYQSSYELGQGGPAVSIFSVNKDPGRATKYVGALILIAGIALFAVTRTKRYAQWRRNFTMKKSTAAAPALLLVLALLAGGDARADQASGFKDFRPDEAKAGFVESASKIDVSWLSELPVQSHGRIKPLDSLARETLLFLHGKFSDWDLSPAQLLVGLSVSNATPYLEIINVRDPELRTRLGLERSRTQFTLQELENSPLEQMARPVFDKQQKDEKSLSESEKKVLEAMQQAWLLREVLTGSYLRQSALLNVADPASAEHGTEPNVVGEKLGRYLALLQNQDFVGAGMAAMELVPLSRVQPMPDLFRPGLDKMKVEVLYNRVRVFFWVGVLYLLAGLLLISGLLKERVSARAWLAMLAPLVLLHAAGFAARVYITGFAPVTNMYGTMVWMAFGVVVFGSVLFGLYRNTMVYGLLLVGSSATLLLTESIPLVLSPDLDPVVAVLRNNFWLTIHVLTISISYAAFTIAMLIGNAYLVQCVLGTADARKTRNLAHIAYRAIQLGVFLLTTGIILGGWWADYSWGRFWGWDPKETWALIADVGFLAILHAKYVSWLRSEGLLSAAPIAYLLVVMAWYGVNFILAAGLHSYGFSSGGTAIVVGFLAAQFALFVAALVSRKLRGVVAA